MPAGFEQFDLGSPRTRSPEGLRYALPQWKVVVILHHACSYCQPTHARLAKIGGSISSPRSVFAMGHGGFSLSWCARSGGVSRPAGQASRLVAQLTGGTTPAASIHRRAVRGWGMPSPQAAIAALPAALPARAIFFRVTFGRPVVPSLYVITYVVPAQLGLSGFDDAVGGMTPLHATTSPATSRLGAR